MRSRLARLSELREIVLIVATVIVVIVVGSIHRDFASIQNIRFMVLGSVVLGLVSLGQTLVISARGIDLSVAPVLGLTALVDGLLAQGSHLPLLAAIVIAVAIGLSLGLLNGVLVALLAIPPIITTLGTYSLISGLMFIVSNGNQVDSVPPSYQAFGNANLLGVIPIPVLVLLACLAAMWFTLTQTRFGRAVLAVGNNRNAAFAAGIPVVRTEIGAYAICGLLAALAGLVFVSYTGSATVTSGTGDHVELQSIAVALIGGAAISGGRGNMLGTTLGSVFLSVVLTALVFVHVPPIWYSAGEGVMILATVTAGAKRRPSGMAPA